MDRKFQRTIEDFTCEHCGQFVSGSGYTNHCPNCLWSKHVDINPGDRANPCKGMMEPIHAYYKSGRWYIAQKCQKCQEQKKIKMSTKDNQDAITALIQSKLK